METDGWEGSTINSVDPVVGSLSGIALPYKIPDTGNLNEMITNATIIENDTKATTFLEHRRSFRVSKHSNFISNEM